MRRDELLALTGESIDAIVRRPPAWTVDRTNSTEILLIPLWPKAFAHANAIFDYIPGSKVEVYDASVRGPNLGV